MELEIDLFRQYDLDSHAAKIPLICLERDHIHADKVLATCTVNVEYNSIIVDAKNRKVIDILPNRFENDLIRYFSQFPSKTEVKYFVCDMNPHFREVAKTCFPKAAVVADRYHVIRQVWYAEFLKFQEKDSVLPYIKIVPERFSPTRPNYLCFVSTPTIDIEHFLRPFFIHSPLKKK